MTLCKVCSHWARDGSHVLSRHHPHCPNAEYSSLLEGFCPRPIQTPQQLTETQAEIDRLIDKGDLSAAEQDFLNLLGLLVSDYESRHETLPDVFGVEMLQVLMVNRDLKQKDLRPIFKFDSITSEVLAGRRNLTARHIQELADFFNVSPAVFFPSMRVRHDSSDSTV